MLDVHPHPHPANSVRDFFLHLFTITVGLLIAVGIEGMVERYEHHETAKAACENLRIEIGTNAESLRKTLMIIDKQKHVMADNLSALQRMQKENDTHVILNGTYQTTHLQLTAWRTA